MKARCDLSRQDAGCEQFEVFQSVSDPDRLVLLKLWKDQAALGAHAKCGGPKIRALFEATYFVGLRKAGVPEE